MKEDSVKRVLCPKCDSDNILIGNKSNKNKCEECGHKWDNVTEECVSTGDIAIVPGLGSGNITTGLPKKFKRKKKSKNEDIQKIADTMDD